MKPIYTLDAETDPFVYGRKPEPFAWGFYRHSYDGRKKDVFDYTWGNDCTQRMIDKLHELEPGIIYIHNGGRFDVFYLLQYILAAGRQLKIVNSRIILCYLPCRSGYHEIRDSWKIFNQPLATYKKTEIDYNKFEADVREQHKEEILSYLKDDCKFLHRICCQFIEQFGKAHLTIGTCSMTELKKFHDIGERFDLETDAEIRQKYYYGARVQYFEQGVIDADKIAAYDVNSMYPYAMAEFSHPIGYPSYDDKIGVDTYFVTVEGTNKGALPFRDEAGEITFEQEYGIFNCSIHEYRVARELGLFDGKVLEVVNFRESIKFDAYVNNFYALRQAATEAASREDEYTDAWYDAKLQREFYKLLLNNSYGKFAMNPENYLEYAVTKIGDLEANMKMMSLTCTGDCVIVGDRFREYECGGWHLCMVHDAGYKLWCKPSNLVKLNNVATGASITGAARAVLLRGLHSVERPLYCDTDSIICAGKTNFEVHSSKLGAWKLEHEGNRFAVYGKKGYNLSKDGVSLKSACKGVRLTPEQIEAIASGAELECYQDAPTFSLDGSTSFIHRTVRRT